MAIDMNRTTTIALPSAVSGEILQKTQSGSAVMQLARQIRVPGLGVTIPVITGDPEAAWVGETGKKPVKRGTLDTKQLTPYTLAVIVPFSNQFKRDIPALYDALVQRLPMALAKQFDATVFGAVTVPGSNFDTLKSCTAQEIGTDTYGGLVAADADISQHDGILNGFVLAPQGKAVLLNAVDGNKRPLFINSVAEGAVPMILGARAIYRKSAYVWLACFARRSLSHTVRDRGRFILSSVWTATARLPHFAALEKDCKTDVLVIGGGMAGCLCAYQLVQRGMDCMLVEADRIGGGTTKNTTAKLTMQHGLIYRDIARRFGLESALLYWQAHAAALREFARLCARIDCDYQPQDSYVYSRRESPALEEEFRTLERMGAPVIWKDHTALPFPAQAAVCWPDQAMFHPLKFLAAIVDGLSIHEETRIREIDGHTAVTADGRRIHAEKIIVATHFPFLNRHGSYFLKLYQHRSYVIALKNAPMPDGMYVDADRLGLSLRTCQDLLLLGGGAHRAGRQGGGWQELRGMVWQYFPRAREVYHWAAQDCMTLDGMPYIGLYSRRTPDIYAATGFNKWGMTGSMAAALLLADLVQGKANPYAALFSPSRTMLRPQLWVNGLEAAAGLVTPSEKRCPHMGCALQWNPQEHSWDCPCHGSRFTEQGALIDNPATGDLKK